MANVTSPHELARRDECTNMGGQYTSEVTKEKASFKLYCGMDYNENNKSQLWTASFAHCMDTCAGYNAGNIATCLGVTYDADSSNGLSNCFLKAANNLERLVKPDHRIFVAFLIQSNPPPQTVTTTAVSSLSATASAPPPPTPTPSRPAGPSETPAPALAGGGPSQAWIAGPVLGAVALLVIAGLVRWAVVRKRNKQRRLANRHWFSKEPAEVRRA